LSKKINATIVVILMILSIFSVASFVSVPAYSQPTPSYGPSPLIVFLQPGVPDPYNTGFSLTLGTLRLNPQVIESDVRSQGTENNFAVLMGSSGDLMFTFTVLSPVHAIKIWLPPQFVFPTTKATPYYIWTDITNDYGYIGVSVRGAYDAYAPGWTRITIGEHAVTYGTNYQPASPMD